MRYSIIARDREPHTNRAKANLILTELKHTLIPYVTNPHIQFQKPNFIIYLQDPGLQQCLLSKQMLQTHTFTLDLVAWSTENEMAQIPWMTGTNYNRLSNHFLPTRYNHAMATKKIPTSLSSPIPRPTHSKVVDTSWSIGNSAITVNSHAKER